MDNHPILRATTTQLLQMNLFTCGMFQTDFLGVPQLCFFMTSLKCVPAIKLRIIAKIYEAWQTLYCMVWHHITHYYNYMVMVMVKKTISKATCDDIWAGSVCWIQNVRFGWSLRVWSVVMEITSSTEGQCHRPRVRGRPVKVKECYWTSLNAEVTILPTHTGCSGNTLICNNFLSN